MKLTKRVKVLHNDKYRTFKLSSSPRCSKELNSVLRYFNAPLCFARLESRWYKLSKNRQDKTVTLYVAKALYLLTFQEWVDIALNESYTAEHIDN